MAQDSEDRTIEISIEALTGTVYDLCVSPYETVLGIKLKVQRLEGIPVYQQQLVWGDTELQDEFCLEEYCISSGAQLRLLIAMRGGPIHAQRVHVDMEDQAFLEIAELLDTQHGDKYALMLLRSGDDLEHASIVQVQMLEDDSMDAVRLSPIHVSESGPQLSISASKTAQLENAMTRDKMKLLMAKLKKGRDYRRQQASFPQVSSGKMSRTATGKLLIVDNMGPSRVLTPARRGSSLAHTHPATDTRRVDRKLVFRGEEESAASQVICGGKVGVEPRAMSGHRSRSYDPVQDTPIITRKTASRIGRGSRPLSQMMSEEHVGDSHRVESRPAISTTDGPALPSGSALQGNRQRRSCQKNSRRRRRSSEVNADITHLTEDLTHLELTPPTSIAHSCLPPHDSRYKQSAHHHTDQRTWRRMGLNDKDHTDAGSSRTGPDRQATPRRNVPSNLSKHHLPPLVPSFKTKSSSVGATRNTGTGFQGHLPSLGVAAGAGRDEPAGGGNGVGRKKRCMKCGKRMGLASTYSCRCGGYFCALHRYAEAHLCSYDYKSEGRQLLARTNPVIAAQKLPKI